MKPNHKEKILIVDDSELNRAILSDMLGEEYDIVEAENGLEAVAALQRMELELSLVLLDIVMPELDGFGVLAAMNQNRWIDDIPVIMISAESDSGHIEQAYELGVTDFIARPFDALIVHHRVVNTILLYAKQKKLAGMVADQIYEKERQGNLMIDILSHIVEFRNGESGLHVLHVRTLTELLLRSLSQKTGRYRLTPKEISVITTASALHDIGKISIDVEILNKPGRLTEEEFTIMKTHTTVGAHMLENLPIHQSDPLVGTAYQICRWHHERYDGRGYPDGLKGDDIPISAQVVALADVYDALTSRRVYKPALPHEEAVQMILDGKCGIFNPLLLECLLENSEAIRCGLNANSQTQRKQREIQSIVRELRHHEELAASERTLQLLEHQLMKYDFFAAISQEILFEYTVSPAMVTISARGAEILGLPDTLIDPLHDEDFLSRMDPEQLQGLSDALHGTTPDQPVVTYVCPLRLSGGQRWYQIICRTTWSADEPARYTGTIGKAVDIHDSRMQLQELEQKASHDALTGLLNHASAKKRILEQIESRPSATFALAIFDLDHFKSANDTYGHRFGDSVLIHVAEKLRQSIRGGDIAARVGGDEFLIFLEYKGDVDATVSRIFESLCGRYADFPISLSMGVARTTTVGSDYETLFRAADQALYTVKRGGRGRYIFYADSMRQSLSVISPIDSGEEAAAVSADQKGDNRA